MKGRTNIVEQHIAQLTSMKVLLLTSMKVLLLTSMKVLLFGHDLKDGGDRNGHDPKFGGDRNTATFGSRPG